MSVIAFKYTLQDKELSASPAQNDTACFETLFKSHYSKLTFFANRFVNNLEVAEEIVSDTFASLWEQRDELKIFTSANGYLYKMVQNRSLNYLKHQKIESEYVDYLKRNNLLSEIPGRYIDQYDQKELKKAINTAVDELPEKCRQVFKLSRYNQLKNKEIAQVLNISQKTVERHITIALERMRYCLQHLLLMCIVFFS